MAAAPPAFPAGPPAGYAPLADEPRFDAARHLALEPPRETWTLADFGYDDEATATAPTRVAAAGPFRLLSEEGVAALHTVAERLGAFRRTADRRTASYVAGVAYRSRFVRDLLAAPALADFLSGIAGTPLAPHAMPSQQAYMNFAPERLEQDVDSWHTDSIGLDIVLAVTDPSRLEGGRLLVFRGTREEARAMLRHGGDLAAGAVAGLPEDRVMAVAFPGAGHAFFQQGNLVVHRAERLHARAERITLVGGFIARDATGDDGTNARAMLGWDEPGLPAELARYKAWVARNRLDALINTLPLEAGEAEIAARLRAAIGEAEALARLLEDASASGRA